MPFIKDGHFDTRLTFQVELVKENSISFKHNVTIGTTDSVGDLYIIRGSFI